MKSDRQHVLFIHNATGSRLYRILPQAKYLASCGWDCKVRGLKAGQTGGISSQDLDWADLVVAEMTYSPQFIRACKKHKCKIIYELDDLMEKVTPKHYAHKDMNPWRTFLTYYVLTMVDGITCTNWELKEHYKWFNSNIKVLPNYLDLDFWEKLYLPNTSNQIRLGWIGGNSHTEDLEFLSPIIEKVLKKYPNVKFICTGYGGTNSPNDWVKYNYGDSFFKNLSPEQYEFSLGTPMEVFPSKIPALRLDIALAPVVKNIFSKCKSFCKAEEYGVNKIPGVYQEFLYKDAVIDGVTGFLATTFDEWFEKICYLIEHEKERKIIGENAYCHIKENFDFSKYAHLWQEFYEQVLAEKACSSIIQPLDKAFCKT